MDNTILCRARILQDINFVDLQYFGVLLEQVLYFDFTKPLTSLIYNSLFIYLFIYLQLFTLALCFFFIIFFFFCSRRASSLALPPKKKLIKQMS